MTGFEYRMRGESSPHGRQRIYFTCHPADLDVYFNEISKIIWKDYDCSIWFYKNEAPDGKMDEYLAGLDEMQLFVIPITANFLLSPCRARDVDLKYALDRGIPILPLMEGVGLDALFAKKCGDLHYIDKNACDVTTLTYEQKIRRFLSRVLFNDETLEKIRDAFYARIFLSYRKKDRAQANRLMELIHDIPFCRDVSIWFDEYLIPGEHFNDAIKNAMKSSDLFVLCVTENLVNEENYIKQVEYPKARELSMPIVPVIQNEMSGEQLDMLSDMYEGIPDCTRGDDPPSLLARFNLSFTDLATAELPDDPMHLFFVGLAYLNGIDVEVCHSRAEELLSRAADKDYLPAIEKLASMYRFGEGVNRCPDKALEYYRRQLELLSRDGNDVDAIYTALHDVLSFFNESETVYKSVHSKDIKNSTMRIMALADKKAQPPLERFKLYSLLAFVNAYDENAADLFVNAAAALIPHLDDTDDALGEETYFYTQLAQLYYENHAGRVMYTICRDPEHKRIREKAISYIYKALELNRRLYKADPVRWKPQYADSLAGFCKMNFSQGFEDDGELVEKMESALSAYRDLCADDPVSYSERLASFTLACGDYLASDLHFTWEEDLGIVLDLSFEETLPATAESALPLDYVLESDYDCYDVRRFKKALALMRHSVSLYEGCIAMGQRDCCSDAAVAYFCLVRLLKYLASLLYDLGDDSVSGIVDGICRDCLALCKRALELNVLYMDLLRERFPGITFNKRLPQKKFPPTDGSRELTEKELLELEELAYERDYMRDIYAMAEMLSEYGFDAEAHELHGEMYRYFKEFFPKNTPSLPMLNLIVYAKGIDDADTALEALLDFDADGCEKGLLFDYYCLIAQFYMSKNTPSEADRYYKMASVYTEIYVNDTAELCVPWAACKRVLGRLAEAEELIVRGLECLMDSRRPSDGLWNELCLEYSRVLRLSGRDSEAEEWLGEMRT